MGEETVVVTGRRRELLASTGTSKATGETSKVPCRPTSVIGLMISLRLETGCL